MNITSISNNFSVQAETPSPTLINTRIVRPPTMGIVLRRTRLTESMRTHVPNTSDRNVNHIGMRLRYNDTTGIFVNGLENLLRYYTDSLLDNFHNYPAAKPHKPIKWNKKDQKINPDSNQECSIRLEQIEEEYCTCQKCLHNFDYTSLEQWLQTKQECPLCRTDWLNYTIYSNK